jgi:hypothetical protein
LHQTLLLSKLPLQREKTVPASLIDLDLTLTKPQRGEKDEKGKPELRHGTNKTSNA